MPLKWSYLGKLGPDDKLDWGGTWTGNIPGSGHILPDLHDVSIYITIRDLAHKGEYEGAQVDWGACAIKVNGPELLAVLRECYDRLDDAPPKSLLGRYVSFATSLGTDKYVAFLSVEL